MQVRTFRGGNTQAVFAKVKQELGDEAVILSNKTYKEKGKTICEIMAAVEQARDGAPAGNGDARKKAAAEKNRLSRQSGEDFAVSSGDWHDEWFQIKDHIMALIKPQMNMETLAPRQRLALEYLEREGVDQSILLTIFRRLRENAGGKVLKVLRDLIPIKPIQDRRWPQKYHVFTGPSGVGKTSMLIRQALSEKKKRPKAAICVVSADTGQGKGRIVLRHYADLSGLAFREISGREDFAALSAEGGSFDKVFIDLPGLEIDSNLDKRLTELGMTNLRDMAVHLVLCPFYAPRQLESFLAKYASAALSSIVWTKLDEACTFGALINVAVKSGLPVSALSYGSGFKNSMTPADGEAVWRLIFKHRLPGDSNDEN